MNIKLYNLDYQNEFLLDKILYWRNENRNNFINTNIINMDTLKNIILPKYKLSTIDPFIISYNDTSIGIISFILENSRIYIGINIDPKYKNRSIGTLSIELLLKILNLDIPIYAKIKKNNIASNKLFSKFFSLIETNDEYNEYIYHSFKNII